VSRRTVVVLSAALTLSAIAAPIRPQAQEQSDEIVRRSKTKVQPDYPELAKRMNLSGTVKIEVVVATNGTVKEARIVGGHPVLANAALDAAKKLRFDPASIESSGVIEFKFQPQR